MNSEEYKSNGLNGATLQMDVLRQMGKLLFEERRRRNLKQATLAACLDVKQELIDMVEMGLGKPHWSVINMILNHYKRQFDIALVTRTESSVEKTDISTEQQA